VNKSIKILFFAVVLFFCFSALLFLNYSFGDKAVKKAKYSISEVSTSAISAPAVPLPVPVKTFNVLIIPGHDVKSGGANYKNIYERDLAAEIGVRISAILNRDLHYNVIVARDTDRWNPILANYFQNENQQIINWKDECQANDKNLIASGQKKYVPDMADHSEVSSDMSVKLYGMNKWANENAIDLVLNLHFNDEQRPNMNAPGDLTGFAIFIPENQMKNSADTRPAAQDAFNELKKIEPPEINHLMEDQSLIALGASGTLNVPSMLIEYAYIYEKELRTDAERENALNKMAEQTALGVEDYIQTTNNK
jgi:N-acetylmuramoyl-L-alanine amidase